MTDHTGQSRAWQEIHGQLVADLDRYRDKIHDSLDGLSEDEARRSLVPSRTTLLGLLKHLCYVEAFYFEHSVTGRPLADLGAATTPDRSFVLRKKDTIDSVRADYRAACERSRVQVAQRAFDQVVTGRGESPLWALHLRALHDLLQHCGHADILREQILAARDPGTT